MTQTPSLQEVFPKAGLVVSEKGQLSEVLCKPKIFPLKSVTLEKLENMEVLKTYTVSVLGDQLHTCSLLRLLQARVQELNNRPATASGTAASS